VEALPPALRFVTPQEVAQRSRAERRGMPFLLHLDGEGRQRIVELDPLTASLSIGRGPASDLALPWDTEVSRAHARLERVGDEWTLADEGLSRNGSFVNGRRVHGRRRLCDGDSITVGHTLLVFRAGMRGESSTTATTQDMGPPQISDAQRRVLTALCAPGRQTPFAAPPSNQELAEQLFLSVETVKSHLRVLFELFGIGDLPQNRKRAELVRRAFERGVVRSEVG
jgi:pSer/pThr/pTyr-binding forkhead associated (FHA) protein